MIFDGPASYDVELPEPRKAKTGLGEPLLGAT